MTDELTFNEVSAISAARSTAWHGEAEPWSLADWGNALGGECGEAQNVIKRSVACRRGFRAPRTPT